MLDHFERALSGQGPVSFAKERDEQHDEHGAVDSNDDDRDQVPEVLVNKDGVVVTCHDALHQQHLHRHATHA